MLNHIYILKEGEGPLFTFNTKHGLLYYVSFQKIDLDNEQLSNLYTIDFGEINQTKFIKDEAIENTIIEIIIEFFRFTPNSLLHYVCDSVDNRHTFRSKLFEKWYNKSKNNEFSKLEIYYEIPDNEIVYKLEFIFKSEFYTLHEVTEKITNQMQLLSNLK